MAAAYLNIKPFTSAVKHSQKLHHQHCVYIVCYEVFFCYWGNFSATFLATGKFWWLIYIAFKTPNQKRKMVLRTKSFTQTYSISFPTDGKPVNLSHTKIAKCINYSELVTLIEAIKEMQKNRQCNELTKNGWGLLVTVHNLVSCVSVQIWKLTT